MDKIIKPRAQGRDREEDLMNLRLIQDKVGHTLQGFEKNFVKDVIEKMDKWQDMILSVKQAEITDKLIAKYLMDAEGSEDPTPSGNPSAQFLAKPVPNSRGFDDIDDDIPF